MSEQKSNDREISVKKQNMLERKSQQKRNEFITSFASIAHTLMYTKRTKYFVEVSKYLARCRSENNFVWTIKIIMYIRTFKLIARILKTFYNVIINASSILRNFDGPIKFSDLYLAKFLNTLAKLFSP